MVYVIIPHIYTNLRNNNKIPNNSEINPQISEIEYLERVDNREILAFDDCFVLNIRIMEIKCVGPENWCVELPLANQSPVIKLMVIDENHLIIIDIKYGPTSLSTSNIPIHGQCGGRTEVIDGVGPKDRVQDSSPFLAVEA